MPDEITPAADPAQTAPAAGGAGEGSDQTPAAPAAAKDALAFLKETTGREFATEEDAQKYLKNLNSMVGDDRIAQDRKDADVSRRVVRRLAKEWGTTEDAVREYIDKNMTDDQAAATAAQAQPNAQTPAAPSYGANPALEAKVLELTDLNYTRDLVEQYPEAKAFLPSVKRLAAATGENYKAVFERDFLPAFKAGREAAYSGREEKIQGRVTQTTRTAPPADDRQKVEEARKRGGKGIGNILFERANRQLARDQQ